MRLPDWERRLSAYIASVKDRPLAYGEHDCILHGCAAAAAMTGVDEAEAFRGQYKTRKGASAILKRLGQGTLLRTIDHHFERKKPSRAQRGDLVWAHGSVGVCLGAHAAFVGEERLAERSGLLMREGLIMVPRREWTKAWAV